MCLRDYKVFILPTLANETQLWWKLHSIKSPNMSLPWGWIRTCQGSCTENGIQIFSVPLDGSYEVCLWYLTTGELYLGKVHFFSRHGLKKEGRPSDGKLQFDKSWFPSSALIHWYFEVSGHINADEGCPQANWRILSYSKGTGLASVRFMATFTWPKYQSMSLKECGLRRNVKTICDEI